MGQIISWTQQVDAAAPTVYEYGYDRANQLGSATQKTTGGSPTILKSYGYAYDKVGNRTAEAIDSAAVQATHDNRNRLLQLQVGGTLRFAGTVNEPAAVTVAGKPAEVTADNRFAGSTTVTSGTNTVPVVATDPGGNVRTQNYQVNVTGTGATFAHDANGNLTSDGVRTYEWDAENRMAAVNQGTRRSEFTYNGANERTRIIEKDGATVLSDRRYLWCGLKPCEERDGAGTSVTRRFFALGVQESGPISFTYSLDHLGSVREMTDASGTLRARYEYDAYGRQAKLTGDKDAAFGFTGHLAHAPSGLLLAKFRGYSPTLGRWPSEDPIGLRGGDANFYRYAGNSPTDHTDPDGAFAGVLVGLGLGAAIVVTIVLTLPKRPTPTGPLPSAPGWWSLLPPPQVAGCVLGIGCSPGGGNAVPMAPPTPFPPPPPGVPGTQVPSDPPICLEAPSPDPCVQFRMCMAQAKGWRIILCVPLLAACLGSPFVR